MLLFQDIYTPETNALLKKHRQRLHEIADRAAQHFYDHLLSHPKARSFLSEEEVQNRLLHSQAAWLKEVLSPHEPEEEKTFLEKQIRIGQVHARIGLPLQLMMLGIRLHKRCFFAALLEGKPADAVIQQEEAQLFITITDIFDYAVYLINEAYMRFEQELESETQLFTATYSANDLALELLHVTAGLQGWLIDILASSDDEQAGRQLQQIDEMDFWLWIEHRLAQLDKTFSSLSAVTKAHDRLQAFIRDFDPAAARAWRGDLKARVKRLSNALQMLSEEVAEESNNRDPLTQLLSRRMLDGILRREHHQVRTHNGDYALLMIDVDRFKQINDTFGHAVGDMVLKEVAQVIRHNLRVTDLAFRYGGEEFLVLLPLAPGSNPLTIAEKLRQAVEAATFSDIKLPELQVTISIGVSQYSRHPHPDYIHLIKEADTALYRAKQAGRNRVVLADAADG